MKKIAVYAGSFDPFTLGHLDVLSKVRGLFDEVHVVVADNRKKQSLFSSGERKNLIRATLEAAGILNSCRVEATETLVADYCQTVKASHIVRGLRAVSDFDGEFSLAVMNRRLNTELTTIHIMADEKYFFLSSSLVKELAGFGRSVDDYVSPAVAAALKTKFSSLRKDSSK
jgi:pantetheine-phosphate adenylyltransferase